MKTLQTAKSGKFTLFNKILLVASTFVLLGRSPLLAQTNLLDNSFGTKGTQMTAIAGGSGSDDEARAIAIQPDGKIILVGKSQDASGHYAFAIARYDADGTLDNTFGTNGTVRTPFTKGGIDDEATCVALQSDGKIVVGGFSEDASGNYAFAVARYNIDGSLDYGFGSSGEVRTAISGGNGTNDYAECLAIQSDGKILVGGSSTSVTGQALALARYNTNGTLDKSFGISGTLRTLVEGTDVAKAISVTSNGAIILAGLSYVGPPYFGFSYPLVNVFEVVHYESDGTLDDSFGVDGVTTETVTSYVLGSDGYSHSAATPYLNSVDALPNGAFVVSGCSDGLYYNSGVHNDLFLIARFNSDGATDNTFGSDGISESLIKGGDGLNDAAYSLLTLSDGKIVAVGTSEYTSGLTKFALARLNSDGGIDTTFGNEGTFENSINGGAGNDRGTCVALQADGKIVAAGTAQTGSGGWAFALARYGSGNTQPPVVSATFSLPIQYQDTSYTIFFNADSAGYAALQAQSQGALAPQAAYLNGYLESQLPFPQAVGYQITGSSIYTGSQLVTSPALRAEVMKAALLWGYYYSNLSLDQGGTNALRSDSAQWGVVYSNQLKQQIGAALAQAVDIGTIMGPITSALTHLFPSSESTQIQNFIQLANDIAGGVHALQDSFPNTWGQIVAAIPGSSGETYDSLTFVLEANTFSNPGSIATQIYNAAYPNSPLSQGDTTAAAAVLSALGTNLLQNAEVASIQAGASFAISYFGYGLTLTTASQIATSAAFQSVSSFANPISIASIIVQNFVMPQAQLLQQEVNLQTCLMTKIFPKLMNLLDSMAVQGNANGDAGIDVANLMGLKSVYQSLWFTTDINLVGIEWLNPNGKYTAQSDSLEAEVYARSAQQAYELEQVADGQSTTLTPVIERPLTVPTEFTLYQNYPNPFNPTTTIEFALKENSAVTLSIFSVLGQRVKEFELGRLNAGTYSQTVDMSRFASGVYFYKLEAVGNDGERYVEMKKMLELK